MKTLSSKKLHSSAQIRTPQSGQVVQRKSLQWSVSVLSLSGKAKPLTDCGKLWMEPVPPSVRKKGPVSRHVSRRKGGTCQLKYDSSALRTRSLAENKVCVSSSSESLTVFHTIFQATKKVRLLQRRAADTLTSTRNLRAWRFSLAVPCMFPSRYQLKGHPWRRTETNTNEAKRSTEELGHWKEDSHGQMK